MNKYVLVGAAAAGLVLGYVIYKKAGAVVDAVGDVAQSVNPLNNANVFNQSFETGFEWLSGYKIEDVLDPGALDVASPNNLVNRNFESAYTKVTGSEDSLGEDIADGVENVKKWFGSLF